MATPTPLKIRAESDGVLVEVLVVPRASKCAVAGVHDGRLKVMLDAPPVDGKANRALLEFLAQTLGRPKRDVSIVRGEKGRQKTVALRGVKVADITALLSATSARA